METKELKTPHGLEIGEKYVLYYINPETNEIEIEQPLAQLVNVVDDSFYEFEYVYKKDQKDICGFGLFLDFRLNGYNKNYVLQKKI